MNGIAVTLGDGFINPATIDQITNDNELTILSIRVNGFDEAVRVLNDGYPDFVFLYMDTNLDFCVRITRHVAANLPRSKMVWLSNQKEFALMAYEENVWHFLKLPLDEDALYCLKKRLQNE